MKITMNKTKILGFYVAVLLVTAVATTLMAALLVNIFERKSEGRAPYVMLVEVTEDTTDASVWGINWPRQYDSYKRTAITTRTRYGGHGGSESLPMQKTEHFPWLTRMFRGYAFALDYRDRRGHAYMLADQEATDRLSVPQSGSCLHCHSSVMPLYRELGGGDAMLGFERSYKYDYKEMNAMLHEMGHAHPVSCVDCHHPETMAIRVTRPGFIKGIQELAASEAEVPHLPSIERWREGSRKQPYDPNKDSSHNEMRSYVCAQCHVEYYCGTELPLIVPWGKGLKVEQIEEYWDELKYPDGRRFHDWVHKDTGAELLKAQHPEFELWSQGIHARSGVSCTDCHMPYMREGASKISDHWVRSPLLNISRSCRTCHHFPEEELLARAHRIQDTHYDMLQRAGWALDELLDSIAAAQSEGATQEQLHEALEYQRQSQWRLDFIVAENSMGFHAPQEAARILAESIDLSRRGQVSALKWRE